MIDERLFYMDQDEQLSMLELREVERRRKGVQKVIANRLKSLRNVPLGIGDVIQPEEVGDPPRLVIEREGDLLYAIPICQLDTVAGKPHRYPFIEVEVFGHHKALMLSEGSWQSIHELESPMRWDHQRYFADIARVAIQSVRKNA